MRAIPILVAGLACTDLGGRAEWAQRQERSTSHELRRFTQSLTHRRARDHLQALLMLLCTSDPRAGWQVTGAGPGGSSSLTGPRLLNGRTSALRMVDPAIISELDATVGFRAPPIEKLVGYFFIFGGFGGLYVFWDKILVPQKRAELAKSKRSGEIKEYLEEIRDNNDTKLEQWLLNDWLEPGQPKARAVPFLPPKKFNSGDNPVIAAVAALMFVAGSTEAVKALVTNLR